MNDITRVAERNVRVNELAIESFALSELELRQRVADLEADVRAYRELLCETLTQLNAANQERKRLTDRLHDLCDLLRRLRSEAAA